MFPTALLDQATALLARYRDAGWTIAVAESCTGGLVAGLLTAVPGSSDVVERGFVTYANEAKMDMLGVAEDLLIGHGAVSAPVARAMALGALAASRADAAVSVTGIAGPGGGTAAKPVGLVHLCAVRGDRVLERDRVFAGDRDAVRLHAVAEAVAMLGALL